MSVVQRLLRTTHRQLSLRRGPAKRSLQRWEGSSISGWPGFLRPLHHGFQGWSKTR